MINEDTIKRIQETFVKTEVIEERGIKYLIRPSCTEKQMLSPIQPATLKISTLSGIVEYLKNFSEDGVELFVYIVSHDNVRLITDLSPHYRTREEHILATVDCAGFRFNRYLPLDEFIIDLMSCFEQDDNTNQLLTFLGSVKTKDELRTDDDGITQKVTVQASITTLAEAKVPNPVSLRQFVTFPEVYQPEQNFVFRMQKKDQQVSCGLFKTDSLHWQMMCINNIRSYLKRELPNIKIIS